MNKHELHPDLQDASLEKACEMANYLVRCNGSPADLPADGPWPHEVTVDLHYMLEYLRLNFDLVPKK